MRPLAEGAIGMGKPLSRKEMQRPRAGWRYSNGDLHAAFDYTADIGTPVFAVRAGTIVEVSDTIPNLPVDVDGKSGDKANFILQRIKYKGGHATVCYAHLSPHVLVKKNDHVEEGQQIALTGHNGHSTGPHLHVSAVIGPAAGNFPERRNRALDALQPTNGVASNGTTVFRPSLVYGREKFNELDAGDIVLEDLTAGTQDSDTVRRLQFRLNGIRLEGGAELKISGNYTGPTRAEVVKWHLQKQHAEPGTAEASGELTEEQAKILFKPKRFRLVHQP